MFWLGLSGCSNVFFFPYHAHVQTPEQLGLKYEDVYFRPATARACTAGSCRRRARQLGTILFLHGNAENVSTHIMSVRWLPERGFNVFLLDYRGYGASEGIPTVAGRAG